MNNAIQSDAFRAAALKSERFRIVGLLLACAFFIVVDIFNGLYHREDAYWGRMGVFIAWWGGVAAYELIGLWIVTRAIRAGRQISPWLWVLNILIECSIPTLALLALTADKQFLGPYRALHSPIVMVYCLMIILSTLRLSPHLSMLSGVVCTAGYVGVLLFTRHVATTNPARHEMPPETYVLFPLALLFCGFAAAGVARQIRGHVLAALAEAETRRKLDRVEHDLQIARSIQRDLLPKHSPTVDGYDIAGDSEAADQTGGDYYDWMQLPDGKILITIADATGHGIGPALLVAACRAYFRAVASHLDPLPRVTQQVDQLLAADIPQGRFITAAVALLDPREHRLYFYSAGHAPTYLYIAASGRVETFDADQPPLGTSFGESSDGEGSPARVITLDPGDALVLVTDGLFECRNAAGEMRGIEQLGESLRELNALEAGAMVRRMRDDVIAYAQGTPQADDMTAVVVKRKTMPVAGA
jgi:serine phosphatase RsbU (regulator of sigma subunit)